MIQPGFLVPRPTQGRRMTACGCAYGALTLCGPALHPVPLAASQGFAAGPSTPDAASPRPRFGLLPVRSPLLGESLLLSSPAGTKMFQFPAFASRNSVMSGSLPTGCPIRKSADQRAFAPPRGLSQLVTSFFASESQGIPHAPLVRSVVFF